MKAFLAFKLPPRSPTTSSFFRISCSNQRSIEILAIFGLADPKLDMISATINPQ
ncbi:hypothetical protein SOVF_055500 [Spinacia oleracea]|nr:hypothetical protein SOVF_055500 [Spinacia oleracea]